MLRLLRMALRDKRGAGPERQARHQHMNEFLAHLRMAWLDFSDPWNAALEWQAGSLRWRSRELMVACPLEGLVRSVVLLETINAVTCDLKNLL